MTNFVPSPPPPFPQNIQKMKAALISYDDTNSTQETLHFQYNPESMRRALRPNTVGAGDGDRSAAMRFTGGAVEIISLEAFVDTLDYEQFTTTTGVLPILEAFSLLLYPTVSQVNAYQTKMSSGEIDVVPPTAPRLVFVWGQNRVVPVRINSLTVTEELYDPDLHPISAGMSLEMRVLTYSDVFPSNGSYSLFLSHQQNMESRAATWRSASLQPNESIGVDPSDLSESES